MTYSLEYQFLEIKTTIKLFEINDLLTTDLNQYDKNHLQKSNFYTNRHIPELKQNLKHFYCLHIFGTAFCLIKNHFKKTQFDAFDHFSNKKHSAQNR